MKPKIGSKLLVIQSTVLLSTFLLILSSDNDCLCEESVDSEEPRAYRRTTQPKRNTPPTHNVTLSLHDYQYPNYRQAYVNKRPLHTKPCKTVVYSATENHTATMIFLVNNGDVGIRWGGCLGKLKPPYMKLICPSGDSRPVLLPSQGIKIMTAWYDKHPNITVYENPREVQDAVRKIHKLIETEMESGIPSERIMLGGYFQGAALSLMSMLMFPHKLAGVIALSTELPKYDLIKTFPTANLESPILHLDGIGEHTDIHNYGEVADSVLRVINKNFEWPFHAGIEQTDVTKGLASVAAFMERIAPPIK